MVPGPWFTPMKIPARITHTVRSTTSIRSKGLFGETLRAGWLRKDELAEAINFTTLQRPPFPILRTSSWRPNRRRSRLVEAATNGMYQEDCTVRPTKKVVFTHYPQIPPLPFRRVIFNPRKSFGVIGPPPPGLRPENAPGSNMRQPPSGVMRLPQVGTWYVFGDNLQVMSSGVSR